MNHDDVNHDDVDDGEILMGCWDCGSCGSRGQRGDSYQCNGCGAPRPDDVQFYLPDEEVVILDTKGISDAEAGADWQCAFCTSWVPATADNCINCYASRADSLRRQQTGEYKPPVREGAGVANQVHHAPSPGFVGPPRRSGGGMALWFFAGVIGLVALAFGGYAFNRHRLKQDFERRVAAQTAVYQKAEQDLREAESEHGPALEKLAVAREEAVLAQNKLLSARRKKTDLVAAIQGLKAAPAVEIIEHAWAVNVNVERCVAQPGEGWERPSQAFDVRSEQRVHHHEKVLDRVDTLFRTETYRAQDGFTTETYTERVKTGTRRVQSGTRTQNLGNGRFRRTPTYRNEPVYQNVTKTRQKPRMVTKTRQVPYQKKVYRDEPIKKPWYTYKTRKWEPAPQLTRSGNGREPLDPEDVPPRKVEETVGAVRQASRSVSHFLELKLTDSATQKRITVNDEQWKSTEDGDKFFLVKSQLVAPDSRNARLKSLETDLAATEERLPPLQEQATEFAEAVKPLEQNISPLEGKIESLRKRTVQEHATLDQIIQAKY